MDAINRVKSSFQDELKNELNLFLNEQKNRYTEEDILKIDMHCHDYNSNVPDELLGRILNVPETWLETEKLINTLLKNKMDVITITNHNNARSCFDVKTRGMDVLVGTEFSCMVPDYNVVIHVLTYGFNKEQERVLNKLRRNIYNFLKYARENDIPTVWAHPLYHYKSDGIPPIEFFNKMGIIFERFEVVNGQRDTWQNLLVKNWLETFTPEKIDTLADEFGINTRLFVKNRYKKSLFGGSDSHMGIFAGQTGTYLHVPDLKKKLKTQKASDLALEAIKEGNSAPFGNHQNFEKLTIAFLDYVCQIAMYKQDPGLMRILLHKGTSFDKILALFVTNAFSELRQHKVTMRFIELFHNCFSGKAPGLSQRLFVPKIYKPVFDDAAKIAKTKDLPSQGMVQKINENLQNISSELNTILFSRLNDKVNSIKDNRDFEKPDLNELVERLEMPSDFRMLFSKSKSTHKNQFTNPNVSQFLDGLSFPFLASAIILGANFTSAKVMYNNRELLNSFSEKLGKMKHPVRTLWLTDTFDDKNGVSMFLQDLLKEIRNYNLPIDILTCSNNLVSEDHLIVMKPMAEYNIPYYENQNIRIPNFLDLHNIFLENSYDRIVCSTEGIMGLVALYLKNAYSVKAHFYMHTDWLMFARKVLGMDSHNLSRVRRFLRFYYKGFDNLFVLNTDHKKWLTSPKMGFDPNKVHLTTHWVDSIFQPVEPNKKAVFGLDHKSKVLLFAGRLSKEKGVMDIPEMYTELKIKIPELKIVFAGTGPAEEELKTLLPDAVFMGWANHGMLPLIYSSADLLVLPSRFDTFSCVVLEALSCGLPAIAYKTKGPKDIIENEKSGYLVANRTEMIYRIIEYFDNPQFHQSYKSNAVLRARGYQADVILKNLLKNIGIPANIVHEKVMA